MEYLLSYDDSYPKRCVGNYENSNPIYYLQFMKAIRLDENAGHTFSFDVKATDLRKWDVLQNDKRLLLVSKRFSEIIHCLCGDDVQLLTAAVMARNDRLDGYMLVNPLIFSRCTNKNESLFGTIVGAEDKIMGFRRLRFVKGCLNHNAMVRDSLYLPHVVVSEEFKSQICSNNIRGIRCIEDWEFGG